MKAFIGIILVVVACASTGASAAAANAKYETCLKRVNEMTKDFVPAEPISQLINKLEMSLDFQKIVELTMSSNSKYNTKVLSYAVALENPDECDSLQEQYEKMRAEDTCMGKLAWMHRGPKDKLMEGDFGRFLRSIFSCFISQKVDFPDDM